MADALITSQEINAFAAYLKKLGLPPGSDGQYHYALRGKPGEAHAAYTTTGTINGKEVSVTFDAGNDFSDKSYNVKAYVDGAPFKAIYIPPKGQAYYSAYLGIISPNKNLSLSRHGENTLGDLTSFINAPAPAAAIQVAPAQAIATQPVQTPSKATQPAQTTIKTPEPKITQPAHHTQPSQPLVRTAYLTECCEWLSSENIEGTRKQAYYDTTDNITVGVGFNMDAPNARKEWDAAFASLPENQRPDFDRVYAGANLPKGKGQLDQLLKPEQIHLLTQVTVKNREKRIIKAYGSAWNEFTPDQKVAISSAFFTNERNVVTNNHFFDNMQQYAANKSTNPEEAQKYLKFAAFELGFNTLSDPNRRWQEAQKLLGVYGQTDADNQLNDLLKDDDIKKYAKANGITISTSEAKLPENMQAALAQALDVKSKANFVSDFKSTPGKKNPGEIKLG